MYWNYAELSKMAKEAGGPELLVETLVDSGRHAGHKEMIPFLLLAAVGGGVAYKIYDSFLAKESKAQVVLNSAKQELIKGIKEYDAVQEKEVSDNKDVYSK